MKSSIFISAIAFLASTASAAFFPLSLQEKTDKADLIVRGKVVSISRLMPDNGYGSDELVGFDDTSGSYMGPRSIAVIEVKDAWKLPAHTLFWSDDRSKRKVIPRRIMVPCDYSFRESPSDLTEGREYVLFLRSMTANVYHPVDPSSTHVVHDGRVADFGMNHPAAMKSPVPGKESFRDRSTPIEEFESSVTAILKKGDAQEADKILP
jgi:hypothetical protein